MRILYAEKTNDYRNIMRLNKEQPHQLHPAMAAKGENPIGVL